MKHCKKIISSILAISFVVIFSSEIVAKNPKYGGEVVWGIAAEPTSLAPFGILLGAAHIGKQLGYDSLVEYDRNSNIKPALATHWENPDERTWIFHLRKGVKFHDGSNFSAEDVIYSLTHMRDPTALDASAASVDGFMPPIESFEAIDDYTIKIVTPKPDATLLGWFAWSRWSIITSKDFYKKFTPSKQINGTGPFKLVEYIPNDRVVYEKNKNFWKSDQPYVDKITLKIIPDEATRIAAVRSGAVHGSRVSSADIIRPLENNPNIQIINGVTAQTRVFQISVKGDGKPWNDRRVRQAMSMAVDRKDLANKVYGGKATLTGPVPDSWGVYGLSQNELRQNMYLQHNPDMAKKLLASAGYPNGFEISFMLPTNQQYEAIGAVVQAHLAKVGIKANLDKRENAQFGAAYRDGSYEMFVNAQGFRLDPTGKLNHWGAPSKAPQKYWYDYPNGWNDEKLKVMFDEAVSTFDVMVRSNLIKEIQRRVIEEATFVYLVNPERLDILSVKIKNWYTDFVDFNQPLRTVWLD